MDLLQSTASLPHLFLMITVLVGVGVVLVDFCGLSLHRLLGGFLTNTPCVCYYSTL